VKPATAAERERTIRAESIRTLKAPRQRLDAGRTASYPQALQGFGLVLAECGKHKLIVP
jgi:hypothetical protein